MTAPGDEDILDDVDEDAEFEALTCGLRRDGTCALAGTEHCDWSCSRSGLAAHNVSYRQRRAMLT